MIVDDGGEQRLLLDVEPCSGPAPRSWLPFVDVARKLIGCRTAAIVGKFQTATKSFGLRMGALAAGDWRIAWIAAVHDAFAADIDVRLGHGKHPSESF